MSAIASWLRSVGQSVRPSPESEGTDTSERVRSSLYHCSNCDTIYVAVEKKTCATCGTAVETVRSTLSETQ